MRISILTLAFIAIVWTSNAQEQFAIGTDSPNPEAILEIQSTDKGILISRMTTAQRNTNLGSLVAGDRGMLIYNTTDSEFNYWNGTQWLAFPSVDTDQDWYVGLGTTPPTAISNNIWTGGNVGIGLNNPAYALDISGDIRIDGSGAANIYGSTVGSMFFFSNSGIALQLENDGGTTGYFRIKNNVGSNIFRVDNNGNATLDGDFTITDGGNDLIFENETDANILVDHTSSATAALDIEADSDIDIVLDRDNNGTSAEFAIKRNNDGAAAVYKLLTVSENNSPLVYPFGTGNGQTGGIRFRELASSGVNYIGLRAPNVLGSNYNLTLPNTDGINGYLLQTDGTGLLSWADPSSLASDDPDWYEEFTSSAPSAITSDIYHTGNVGIGYTSGTNITAALQVNSSSATYSALQVNHSGSSGNSIDINLTGSSSSIKSGINQDHETTGTGNKFAIYNAMRGSGSGSVIGVRNWFLNTSGYSSDITGTSNDIDNNNNGTHYGTANYLSGTGSGTHYGTYTWLDGTGTGIRYGTYSTLSGTPSSGSNTHYGVYSHIFSGGNGDRYGAYHNVSASGNGTHYGSYQVLSGTGSGLKVGIWNENPSSAGSGFYGMYNNIAATNTSNKYAINNQFGSSTGGGNYGVVNNMNSTTTGIKCGVCNTFSSGSGGTVQYGVYNDINTTTSSVPVYGSYTDIDNGSGNINAFGHYVDISNAGFTSAYGFYANLTSTTNGNAYGIYTYTDTTTTGKWAGYFKGRTFIEYRLGIQVTHPSYRLQLNENSAAKPTSSSWIVASDARLKKNVRNYEGGLDLLERMRPVWFTYNGRGGMPGETGVGLIAQELKEIAPYMVHEWEYVDSQTQKSEDYLAIDYGAMDFIIVNSVQELKRELDETKAKLEAKNETIKALIQRLEALEAKAN